MTQASYNSKEKDGFDNKNKLLKITKNSSNESSKSVQDESITNKSSKSVQDESITNKKKKRKRPWRQVVRHRAKRLKKDSQMDEKEHIKDTSATEKSKKKKRRKKKKVLFEEVTEEKNTIQHLNRLDGSRFRFLNEKLYTSNSTTAKQMFEEDRDAYEAYHKGYRQQIQKWPINPVNKIIIDLNNLPHTSTIADVGCGDAKIAEKLGHKYKIYSFDLVSTNTNVIAADMAHLPLDGETIDVAIYCLSLMGTNLCSFLREANRILKIGGKLKICEVASRFRSVKKFTEAIEKMGFTLKRKQSLKNYFVLLSFTKIEKTKERRPLGLILNPCLYKKR